MRVRPTVRHLVVRVSSVDRRRSAGRERKGFQAPIVKLAGTERLRQKIGGNSSGRWYWFDTRPTSKYQWTSRSQWPILRSWEDDQERLLLLRYQRLCPS
jgi:hypothetical protein